MYAVAHCSVIHIFGGTSRLALWIWIYLHSINPNLWM